jgi:hypothetical protein
LLVFFSPSHAMESLLFSHELLCIVHTAPTLRTNPLAMTSQDFSKCRLPVAFFNHTNQTVQSSPMVERCTAAVSSILVWAAKQLFEGHVDVKHFTRHSSRGKSIDAPVVFANVPIGIPLAHHQCFHLSTESFASTFYDGIPVIFLLTLQAPMHDLSHWAPIMRYKENC